MTEFSFVSELFLSFHTIFVMYTKTVLLVKSIMKQNNQQKKVTILLQTRFINLLFCMERWKYFVSLLLSLNVLWCKQGQLFFCGLIMEFEKSLFRIVFFYLFVKSLLQDTQCKMPVWFFNTPDGSAEMLGCTNLIYSGTRLQQTSESDSSERTSLPHYILPLL